MTKKADSTHVTDADQAVERALRERLAAERPDDAFLGEETTADTGAEAVSEGHRQWVVDPIDGTANYLRGVPVWATLIALAVDGRPVLGVVSAPALGKRWWAAEASGAFSLDGPLRVSGVSEPRRREPQLQQHPAVGRRRPPRAARRPVAPGLANPAYGDMWSYMMVAEGVLDVAGEPDLKPWDIAALVPIVEEAGGRFTSLDGDPGPWHGSALASNGLVHDAVVEVIRRDA